MVGRPPKDDSRNKQYRVRLNEVEEKMLNYCSHETGEAKSMIFRKALKAYYENTKYVKTMLMDADYEDHSEEHISLKRTINCPYCHAANNVDFEEDYDSSSEERQMGPEVSYSFDWKDCTCIACQKRFGVQGYICEYPLGAYNCEEINVVKY